MAKVKKIKTIGGFKVKDLFAPQIEGVIQDKKGNLVKKSTGEVLATHKEILKEKQRYQRLVKAKNFELGGERYNSLSKEEKQKLKSWGFSKSDLKKLAFTNKYSEAMRKSGGNQLKSGALSFSDILYKKQTRKVTKYNKKTGEVKDVIEVKKVKREHRRSSKQNLYSGKTAIEKRKKFISGRTYADKRELYRENYLKALETGNLQASSEVKEALKYIINGVVNFDDYVPDLRESYKGYELHPLDYIDKLGVKQKSTNSLIKDLPFYRAYLYTKDIENETLKNQVYSLALVEFTKTPNLDFKDSKLYKALRNTDKIQNEELKEKMLLNVYLELLKE